jgi:hypothetical protein
MAAIILASPPGQAFLHSLINVTQRAANATAEDTQALRKLAGEAKDLGWRTLINLAEKIRKSVEDLLTGKEYDGETSTGTEQWNDTSGDGIDAADQDYDELGPETIKDLGDGRRIGRLPDGRKIVVRPKSGSRAEPGPPTIDIQSPDGKDLIKIRYR